MVLWWVSWVFCARWGCYNIDFMCVFELGGLVRLLFFGGGWFGICVLLLLWIWVSVCFVVGLGL